MFSGICSTKSHQPALLTNWRRAEFALLSLQSPWKECSTSYREEQDWLHPVCGLRHVTEALIISKAVTVKSTSEASYEDWWSHVSGKTPGHSSAGKGSMNTSHGSPPAVPVTLILRTDVVTAFHSTLQNVSKSCRFAEHFRDKFLKNEGKHDVQQKRLCPHHVTLSTLLPEARSSLSTAPPIPVPTQCWQHTPEMVRGMSQNLQIRRRGGTMTSQCHVGAEATQKLSRKMYWV